LRVYFSSSANGSVFRRIDDDNFLAIPRALAAFEHEAASSPRSTTAQATLGKSLFMRVPLPAAKITPRRRWAGELRFGCHGAAE